MAIIAMRATSAIPHPDADTLRVYTFEAPDQATVQVVANQDHVYETGDVAIIALRGTTLLDGMTIKRTKLRGVLSVGMAMGKTDAEPGTDLSEGRCRPETSLDHEALVKWTSIELLHNVVGDVVAKAELDGEPPPKLEYRAKVKLHGTNCGVQIRRDGAIVAQGRNRTLTIEDDNMGFAAWVLRNKEHFDALVDPKQDLFLFGEWCGAGIQRSVSICEIGRKVFAIFAIQLGDHRAEEARLVTSPEALVALLGAVSEQHEDIFVLPWHGEPVMADFADLEPVAEALNAVVAAVEENDPWVLATFGVNGTGEGIVLYPQLETDLRDEITSLMFKAKGDKHRVRKSKKAVEVDPDVLRSVEAFVATFVTEARLSQGLAEACPERPTMKDMGGFLRWVGQDIKKESQADLDAAALEWKHVGKAVTSAAKTWFVANHMVAN